MNQRCNPEELQIRFPKDRQTFFFNFQTGVFSIERRPRIALGPPGEMPSAPSVWFPDSEALWRSGLLVSSDQNGKKVTCRAEDKVKFVSVF
jgi:hypothetical protein